MEIRHVRTVIVLLLVAFIQESHTAGVITQITVAVRAKTYFSSGSFNGTDYRQILNKNYDAVIAGSVFPDAFRECAVAQYKQVSEDTHYTGFLNASVTYIRNTYPQPWSNETKKLVAFLMGVASNQVSTMLFDGIGVTHGFVDTMANVNFHGSYKDARKSSYFGADAVTLFKSNILYLALDQEWYFPVNDLYNIYKDYYGTVKISADVIDNCTTLQVLEAIVELALLAESYGEIAQVSPFLTDQTKDYFLGGINDMAGWTQRIWNNTVIMLQNGVGACDLPKNPLYVNCKKMHKTLKQADSHRSVSEPLRDRSLLLDAGVTIDDAIVKTSKHGKYVTPNKMLQMSLSKAMKKLNRKKKSHKTTKEGAPQNYLYYSNHSFTRLGWSMAVGDIDQDGNEDIAVGSPGYSGSGNFQQGRVYIIYGSDYGLPRSAKYGDHEELEANYNYTSYYVGDSTTQTRYGSSVALLDMNLDGALDLVVGASSFSNEGNLGYNGVVYVYFGKPKSKLDNHAPNIIISCEVQNCNLGFSLAVADLNGDGNNDLILGTPFYSSQLNQSGIVSGLPSSKSYTGIKNFKFEDLIAKFSLNSTQEYSWFGYSLKTKDDVLIVSQPYYRNCGRKDCVISQNDTQGIGAVHVYNFGDKVKFKNFTTTGMAEYDLLGAGADIGYPFGPNRTIFAVGVPGASVYGSFYGIPFHFRQGGTVLLYDISGSTAKLVANFDGDRLYDRFGSSVLLDDINGDGVDDLVVSSPLRTNDAVPIFDQGFELNGHVYTFFGGEKFPDGNQTQSTSRCEYKFPCPQRVANFTVSGDDSGDEFGLQMKVLKTKYSNSLVSSSEHWTDDSDLESETGIVVNTINRTSSIPIN